MARLALVAEGVDGASQGDLRSDENLESALCPAVSCDREEDDAGEVWADDFALYQAVIVSQSRGRVVAWRPRRMRRLLLPTCRSSATAPAFRNPLRGLAPAVTEGVDGTLATEW